QRRDPPAALVVGGRGEGEIPDRIVAIRVESERDHDDVAGRGGDLFEAAVHGREIGRVVGSGGERNVEVRATPLPFALLVRPTEEERELTFRVGVERHVLDVTATPEDLL